MVRLLLIACACFMTVNAQTWSCKSGEKGEGCKVNEEAWYRAIGELRQEFEEMQALQQAKHDGLQERVDALEDATDGLQQQLENLPPPDTDELEERVDALETANSALQQQVEALEGELSEHEHKAPVCRDTVLGLEYTGTIAVTADGTTCQRWDETTPHDHQLADQPDLFPDDTVAKAKNYCRNPTSADTGPWCYTTDPNVPSASCDVPYCEGEGCSSNPCQNGGTCVDGPGGSFSCDCTGVGFGGDHCDTACKTTTMGKEYIGTLTETNEGQTCQRWDSQSPHGHPNTTPDKFPDETMDEASNYCRNPDNAPHGPWCYTTDPNVRWRFCAVDFCP